MKLMKAMLCAVILGAFSVPALAAPAKAEKPTPTKVKKAKKSKRSKKARKGKTKVATKSNKARDRIKKYEFLGDELEGNIGGPGGTTLHGRIDATFTNLIKVRTSFLPEITKAADNL